MPKFSLVNAGDILYDVRRMRMGNTTMSRTVCYSVRVVSIDYARHTAVCSWNNNKPTLFTARYIAKLRRTRPKSA